MAAPNASQRWNPRVPWTIADLDASETIEPPHISEAINYRMLDRQMWT